MPNVGKQAEEKVLSRTRNSPLPPTIEVAYYQKCIQLKRRIAEIEEHNDAARLRKARIERAILKMRLERAFLLEQIAKRRDNPEESDRSTSPPPTPQEKPLRSKRAHRKGTPPSQQAGSSAAAAQTASPSGSAIAAGTNANANVPPPNPFQPINLSPTHSTPDAGPRTLIFNNATIPPAPPALQGQPAVNGTGAAAEQAPGEAQITLPSSPYNNGAAMEDDEERENGHGPAASTEERRDADGDREMGDAEAGSPAGGSGFGGGFTAVNRHS